MDYEFFFNDDGTPTAEFSMGHEVIGRWLTEELGTKESSVVSQLELITQIEQGSLAEKNILGNELVLSMDKESVEVKVLDMNVEDELPENTKLYDDEHSAQCGLLDFKSVLIDWQEFIK